MINSLIIEFITLITLGILYYFYQKRKLINHEKNKIPYLMSLLLQSSLSEKGDQNNEELDSLILKIDDYLKFELENPPLNEISQYRDNPKCSQDFKIILTEVLTEINGSEKK